MSLSFSINRVLRRAGVQLVRTETLKKMQALRPCEVTAASEPSHPGVFNIDHLIDDMLADLMLRPTVARQRIAERLGVAPASIVALETSRWTLPVDLETIFVDNLGKTLVSEYGRHQSLLATFDARPMGKPLSELLTRNYVDTYFRDSITRVYHLVQILRAVGLRSGSILEVGSFFGTFAGPLQRLGYHVTAVDRYRKFDGALDAFVGDLRASGVRVIETNEDREVEDLRRLGQFDAVISMAVIEHIPHTPRVFLASLASHVKSGGVLALDTPNIARYSNRQHMREGRSIHQDIAFQFFSPIPFEGHHREFTADEMRWMLEQVGSKDIQIELFDYNLFQSEIMTRNHIDVMMAMASDESLADTILAVGRL